MENHNSIFFALSTISKAVSGPRSLRQSNGKFLSTDSKNLRINHKIIVTVTTCAAIDRIVSIFILITNEVEHLQVNGVMIQC